VRGIGYLFYLYIYGSGQPYMETNSQPEQYYNTIHTFGRTTPTCMNAEHVRVA